MSCVAHLQATCYNLIKNSEGVKRHARDRDYENLARSSNLVQIPALTKQDQIPDSQVVAIVQAEFLTFRLYIGGDNIVTFSPLAFYTQ